MSTKALEDVIHIVDYIGQPMPTDGLVIPYVFNAHLSDEVKAVVKHAIAERFMQHYGDRNEEVKVAGLRHGHIVVPPEHEAHLREVCCQEAALRDRATEYGLNPVYYTCGYFALWGTSVWYNGELLPPYQMPESRDDPRVELYRNKTTIDCLIHYGILDPLTKPVRMPRLEVAIVAEGYSVKMGDLLTINAENKLVPVKLNEPDPNVRGVVNVISLEEWKARKDG